MVHLITIFVFKLSNNILYENNRKNKSKNDKNIYCFHILSLDILYHFLNSCLLAVGPGAAKDKEYKNPEYFCYHIDSFGEAEVELAKYRLPAPSNKVPFKR